MKVMLKCKCVILFTAMIFSGLSYAQVVLEQNDFTSKNILAQIFDGDFQEEMNVQKWRVSKVQALDMSSYMDENMFAYTLVDTILSFHIDTSDVKIVLFKTMVVDSSGWIQDCFGCPPQIGLAYFIKNNENYDLRFFRQNLIINGHGFYIPKSHIEKIGPTKYALVLTEEVMQDQGREFWFDISNDFNEFFSYYYLSLTTASEHWSIVENSIEIVPTENEYFDLIVNSKISPADTLDSKEKIAKIKTNKKRYSYNNFDMMQHVPMPFGYSIEQ
jgi:hypothetical protein